MILRYYERLLIKEIYYFLNYPLRAGISKIALLTGHNSYLACRYCDLRGMYNNHVYYPTTPPSDASNTNETYDPSNLPKRTHNDYVARIGQLATIPPSRIREVASNLGKIIYI
jgi:hypothetical protein